MVDILALSYYNIKKSNLIEALNDFGSATAILDASLYELTVSGKFSEQAAEKILSCRDQYRTRALAELEVMKDYKIAVWCYGKEGYPSLLSNCEDAPLVLYSLGNCNLEVSNEKWISVIGTRSSTDTGFLTAKKMIDDIADDYSNTVIVSSLSEGIERITHKAAIKRGLRTVAILPCSIDNIQNESFRELAAEILKSGGTLISEYPLKQKYYKNIHSERNRIVAGISHITIVVEAPLKSNTLQTASIAESYNREVFAFPGRVTDNSYKGNNLLIKSGRAQMMLSFEDVAISLEIAKPKETKELFAPQLTHDERLIYNCLTDGDAHSEEEILEKTELTTSAFLSAIMNMELDDVVVSLIGKMYILKPR